MPKDYWMIEKTILPISAFQSCWWRIGDIIYTYINHVTLALLGKKKIQKKQKQLGIFFLFFGNLYNYIYNKKKAHKNKNINTDTHLHTHTHRESNLPGQMGITDIGVSKIRNPHKKIPKIMPVENGSVNEYLKNREITYH